MSSQHSVTKHGITLSRLSDAADPVRVAALEGKLGVRLPDDYRDSLVDWFLALYDGEHSNLETVCGWLVNRLPDNLLPIALDPFGNVVLLGLVGEHRGKIYFWDHENEPARQPNWSNIDLVADGFDTFLRELTPVHV